MKEHHVNTQQEQTLSPTNHSHEGPQEQQTIITDVLAQHAHRNHQGPRFSWEALFETYPLPSPQYQLLTLAWEQEALQEITQRLQDRALTYREEKQRPEGTSQKQTVLAYSPYCLQPPAFDATGQAVFSAPGEHKEGVTLSLWFPHRIILFPSGGGDTRTYLDLRDPEVVRAVVYQRQERSCTTYTFSLLANSSKERPKD
jgi:hypothetical protein